MFAIDCPRHNSRVLIWSSSIDEIRNVGGEIHVDLHCTCGWEATLVTGLGVEERLVEKARPPLARAARHPALTGPLSA